MSWLGSLHRFAIGLLLAAALPLGCGRPAEHAKVAKPMVRVETPRVMEVTDYVYYTGRTAAVDAVEVRARVTGYLVSYDFKPGDEVKKGQRLFKIDPRPYKAALDQALGQVALSEAKLKLAIADYERAKAISKTPGAISQQDIDKYAAAQGEAEAALVVSKANSESANLDFQFTDVLSPIDGIVGRNLLTIGNLVNQDKTLLTTIVSADPMYAYFDVDERTMLRAQQMIRDKKLESVRQGARLPVQLGLATEGDRFPHDGYLDFVNNSVDGSTGTIQIRGVFPNPAPAAGPRLLTPGLFVRIRLPLGELEKSLVVPQAAIGTDQNKKFLLVVNDKNVVEYRPVALGPELPDGLQMVVPVKIVRTEEGIKPGEGEIGEPSITAKDRVIISGLQRVRPGMTVEIKTAAK